MRLGGSADLTEPLPERPKGMHWRTYTRFYREAEGREAQFTVGLEAWLDRVEKRTSASGMGTENAWVYPLISRR
jgi:hypothetical protein